MAALDARGFTYGHPYGAFYIFANTASTGLPAFALSRTLLTKATTHLSRYRILPPGGHYLRFSLLQPTPVLMEAVTRLERVLKG